MHPGDLGIRLSLVPVCNRSFHSDGTGECQERGAGLIGPPSPVLGSEPTGPIYPAQRKYQKRKIWTCSARRPARPPSAYDPAQIRQAVRFHCGKGPTHEKLLRLKKKNKKEKKKKKKKISIRVKRFRAIKLPPCVLSKHRLSIFPQVQTKLWDERAVSREEKAFTRQNPLRPIAKPAADRFGDQQVAFLDLARSCR